MAASNGSSHSAAARAARCSWLLRKRVRALSCSARLASVTSRKIQATPSGTASSVSDEASRKEPLRQQRRGGGWPRSAPSPRTVTQISVGSGGAPSASTCWKALSTSSMPWSRSSPSGRPSSVARPAPSERAAWPLTTAERRSASTMTTPQDASSNSASLSAMERSRSIWVCTSLKAQYTPAALPSAPGTAADWVRTRTRPQSLVSSANSCTWRPCARIAPRSSASASAASADRTAQPARPRRPTASSADQPSMRSASRFQWVTVPSASNAHSAASMPSSRAASRSESSRFGRAVGAGAPRAGAGRVGCRVAGGIDGVGRGWGTRGTGGSERGEAVTGHPLLVVLNGRDVALGRKDLKGAEKN